MFLPAAIVQTAAGVYIMWLAISLLEVFRISRQPVDQNVAATSLPRYSTLTESRKHDYDR